MINNFSYKNIKWFRVLRHIIMGKLKIKDIKNLYRLIKFIDNLVSKKKFDLKTLKKLSIKEIYTSVKIFNKYTDPMFNFSWAEISAILEKGIDKHRDARSTLNSKVIELLDLLRKNSDPISPEDTIVDE